MKQEDEIKTIKRGDIEEVAVMYENGYYYKWECPYCDNKNENIYDPQGEDECWCEECGKMIAVVD